MPSGEVFFIDGFNHYDSGEITSRWDIGDAGFYPQTSIYRSGRAALRRSVTEARDCQKNLPTTAYNLTVGFGAYYTALAGEPGYQFMYHAGTQCSVRLINTGALEVRRGTYLETLLDTSNSGEISADQWHYIEIAIHSHQTLGSYEVRVDGNTILSGESVDMCAESSSGISAFRVKGCANVAYIDDLYILSGEEFLGDMEVVTLYPTAAGNYTQWTPSGEVDNYACVNNTVFNGATYLVCSGEEHIDTYEFGDLTEVVVDNIHAVQLSGAFNKPGAGTEAVSLFTRIGSNDYSGEWAYLPASTRYKSLVYTNNPDDSLQWELSDVNNAEFGVKREDV